MSRKKRVLSILFYIFIIIIICLTITFNKDYSIIKNRYIINNEETYKLYKNYKFVTIDLSNSVETRFSLNDKNKLKSTMYIVTFDDIDILVELSPSTVTTNKVDVIYKENNSYSDLLKGDLSKESDTKYNFVNGYYTNINIKENEDLVRLKMNISKGILLISIIMIFINFIKLLLSFISKKDYVI